MTDCTEITFDISFQQQRLGKITFSMGTECHNFTQAHAGMLKGWGGGCCCLKEKEEEENSSRKKVGRGLPVVRNVGNCSCGKNWVGSNKAAAMLSVLILLGANHICRRQTAHLVLRKRGTKMCIIICHFLLRMRLLNGPLSFPFLVLGIIISRLLAHTGTHMPQPVEHLSEMVLD